MTSRPLPIPAERIEVVDDDRLAQSLGLRARQQANMRCRELEREGFAIRSRVKGKIHNFWIGNTNIEVVGDRSEEGNSSHENRTRPWFWEGNVQSAAVRYLVGQGYLIRSAANTANREQGKDIVAERLERQLWVSVKGYPKGTDKTKPSTQAGHWFKHAIFDIIKYRGESENVELGVALPNFDRYRSMANKITWFKCVGKFTYYWVQEDGRVIVM